MRDLPDLLLHVYALHGTLENSLQRANQDVDDIPEKALLHAKDALIIEHVFSTVPVMPYHYSIRPHSVRHHLSQVEYDVTHMIRTTVLGKRFGKSIQCK